MNKKISLLVIVLLSVPFISAKPTYGQWTAAQLKKVGQIADSVTSSEVKKWATTKVDALGKGIDVGIAALPEKAKQVKKVAVSTAKSTYYTVALEAKEMYAKGLSRSIAIAKHNPISTGLGGTIGTYAGWKLAGIGSGEAPTVKRRMAQCITAGLCGASGALFAGNALKPEMAQKILAIGASCYIMEKVGKKAIKKTVDACSSVLTAAVVGYILFYNIKN